MLATWKPWKWNYLYNQVLNLPTVPLLQVTCPTVKNYISCCMVKQVNLHIIITATSTLVINTSIETTTGSLMPTFSYETCCPKLHSKYISVNCEYVYTEIFVKNYTDYNYSHITSAVSIIITCRYICTYWIKTYWIEKNWNHWEFDADFKLWNLLPKTTK